MDFRIRWPIKMALLSLGNLAAAFLSDWSLVFVGAALGSAALVVYTWPRPRRSGLPLKKAGSRVRG